MPKPMVAVNGRPFLQYLLEQLAENGINRFVLLTGYLGEKIFEYFGDGSSWGWSISYSNGPVEWSTTKRIHEALNQIDEQFLLLYSDNFAQLRLSELAQVNRDCNSAMTLSVVRKFPGNIQLDTGGLVAKYDSSRLESSADYVEIGYSLISKSKIIACLDEHIHENFSSVIQSLTDSKQVSAVEVATGYSSISDSLRLASTEVYLKPHKILLLDRDGTLNVKPERGRYVNSISEFQWIESSRDALRILGERGFSFIIISNQAGVATGATKLEDLNKINEFIRAEFLALGLRLLEIYVCTDHWNSESEFRKPNPGMFFTAAIDHKFRLDHSIYVGDDTRDAVAAKNAGCEFIFVSPDYQSGDFDFSSTSVSLLSQISKIISTYDSWMN
jgi:D-glycero-D-manno-heptose 1,7-bisphosphate phosphatase